MKAPIKRTAKSAKQAVGKVGGKLAKKVGGKILPGYVAYEALKQGKAAYKRGDKLGMARAGVDATIVGSSFTAAYDKYKDLQGLTLDHNRNRGIVGDRGMNPTENPNVARVRAKKAKALASSKFTRR